MRTILDLSQFAESRLPKELREEQETEPRKVQFEMPVFDTYRELHTPDAQQLGMLKESLRAKHQTYRSSRPPLAAFLAWWYR
jgi:hypothetical protein